MKNVKYIRFFAIILTTMFILNIPSLYGATLSKASEQQVLKAKLEIDKKLATSNKPLVDLKNTICPVMNRKVVEGIGGVYNNYLVHLCCAGCIKAFNKNPEKYLKIAQSETNKSSEHQIKLRKVNVNVCPVDGEKTLENNFLIDNTKITFFCSKKCHDEKIKAIKTIDMEIAEQVKQYNEANKEKLRRRELAREQQIRADLAAKESGLLRKFENNR